MKNCHDTGGYAEVKGHTEMSSIGHDSSHRGGDIEVRGHTDRSNIGRNEVRLG